MIVRRLEEKMFTRLAPRLVKYLTPVAFPAAEGLVAQVYQQMRRDFQLVPPVTLHSPLPKVLAGVWGMLRESLVAGPVSRAGREVVAESVSRINRCSFCVDAHSALLYGVSEKDVADAIRDGRPDQIRDPKTRSIAEWAFANRSPGAEILSSPPFSRDEAPEIIGTAITFHYIDRMAQVFLADSPVPLPSGLRWMRGFVTQVAGATVGKRVMSISVRAGGSEGLLPAGLLSREFSWAQPKPAVAAAFGLVEAVVEEAGKAVLPKVVCDLVRHHVGGWNGEDPGMSRKWVDEATAGLSERDKAAGRFTLLTALAAYQVDDSIVLAFRSHFPPDESLLAAAAWASFTATKRLASWLQPASTEAFGRNSVRIQVG
jgi:AhpD family alkylhydroperoxidase